MKTVWKFPLETGVGSIGLYGERKIEAPFGVEFIHVDHQEGQLCLWGLVADQNKMQSVTVYITGTGTPMPNLCLDHIGSSYHAPYIWHVWREAK